MNYNADEVLERIRDPKGLARKAQVGVDLTVRKIEQIKGIALFEGDSKLNRDLVQYEETPTFGEKVKTSSVILKMYPGLDNPELLELHKDDYYLEPNSHYVIEFDQGIELADNEWGYILHRSSMNRCGVFASSACWDSCFETDIMGTTIHTGSVPVILPKGTRIGQILIFENHPVTEGYNGQWQGMANHN